MSRRFMVTLIIRGAQYRPHHTGSSFYRDNDLLGMAVYSHISQPVKPGLAMALPDKRLNPGIWLKLETSFSILTLLLFGYQSNKWLQL